MEELEKKYEKAPLAVQDQINSIWEQEKIEKRFKLRQQARKDVGMDHFHERKLKPSYKAPEKRKAAPKPEDYVDTDEEQHEPPETIKKKDQIPYHTQRYGKAFIEGVAVSQGDINIKKVPLGVKYKNKATVL